MKPNCRESQKDAFRVAARAQSGCGDIRIGAIR